MISGRGLCPDEPLKKSQPVREVFIPALKFRHGNYAEPVRPGRFNDLVVDATGDHTQLTGPEFDIALFPGRGIKKPEHKIAIKNKIDFIKPEMVMRGRDTDIHGQCNVGMKFRTMQNLPDFPACRSLLHHMVGEMFDQHVVCREPATLSPPHPSGQTQFPSLLISVNIRAI